MSCQRKVKVVRERCEEIGRDPATLETSMLLTVFLDDNVEAGPDPRGDDADACWPAAPTPIAEQIQDQGARRWNRRRDHQHAVLYARRSHRRRRCAASAGRSLTAVARRVTSDVPGVG